MPRNVPQAKECVLRDEVHHHPNDEALHANLHPWSLPLAPAASLRAGLLLSADKTVGYVQPPSLQQSESRRNFDEGRNPCQDFAEANDIQFNQRFSPRPNSSGSILACIFFPTTSSPVVNTLVRDIKVAYEAQLSRFDLLYKQTPAHTPVSQFVHTPQVHGADRMLHWCSPASP